MFELSVACKYLRPRWRQLSVSIISMISMMVIALVVWLIVVFFSVTHGLEKSWIQKLIALTAPVRITPTAAYYHSYYYQIDGISSNSNYSLKTIGEKQRALQADPYDGNLDEEVPAYWVPADRRANGSLKDIVQTTFQAIGSLSQIPGIKAHDYETTVSNLKLRLVRNYPANGSQPNHSTLSQATYLGSLDADNAALSFALIPMKMTDLSNLYNMLTIAPNNSIDNISEQPAQTGPGENFSNSDLSLDSISYLDQIPAKEKMRRFFDSVAIRELKTADHGWALPSSLLPQSASFQACVMFARDKIMRVIIPQDASAVSKMQKQMESEGYTVRRAEVVVQNHQAMIKYEHSKELVSIRNAPLVLQGDVAMRSTLVAESLENAYHPGEVQFLVNLSVQGVDLSGVISYGTLQIAQADIKKQFHEVPSLTPFWLYSVGSDKNVQLFIPSDAEMGEGILLPRSFRDSGALVGDRGVLSYYAPTLSSVQEQRLPVYVAGFYDPGIIPIGGKFVLANPEVINLVRASHEREESALSNGINVRFDNLEQAEDVKAALQEAFEREGIAQYWKIETFRDFDFTRDLIQQLRSERNLWTLIATVIIIVACSNIISMLIILVNDKKVEIGILRSMGASAASIAFIFGFCGVVMGVMGSVIGTLIAIVTLKNLQSLIDLISGLQGHQLFNPVFYGNTLPSELSFEALAFVIIATSLISLLAGIIPAVKAGLVRPSAILRSE